jgi:MFS family permease
MTRLKRAVVWVVFLLGVAASFAIVIAPAWIIQPFRPQSSDGLRAGYLLRSWSPVGTVILFCATTALCVYLWRHSKHWWSKTALIIVFLISIVPAWFARQNYFEWMFKPLPNAGFSGINEASFVSDQDKVIGIAIGGEAVAYPIRQIAYHHVVQDQVGGLPVVATY